MSNVNFNLISGLLAAAILVTAPSAWSETTYNQSTVDINAFGWDDKLDMSIRIKLYLGFGILILLAALQGGFSVIESKVIGQLVADTYNKSLMTINFARAAQTNFLIADRMLAPALRGTENAHEAVDLEELVEASELVVEDLEVAKERSNGKRSVELIDKITALNNAWIESTTDGLKKLATSENPAVDVVPLRKSLSDQSKAILDSLGLLVEYAAEDGYNPGFPI